MCAEVVGEAVPGRRPDHRHFAAHLVEDLVHAPAARRVVFGVQAEVEQRELHLAQRDQAGLEIARAQQSLDLLLRQWLAGLRRGASTARSTSGCQA